MDANEWLRIEKLPGGARTEIERLTAEVAALRAVAEAARAAIRTGGFPEVTDALDALDALSDRDTATEQ
jgi:hypothetical protein